MTKTSNLKVLRISLRTKNMYTMKGIRLSSTMTQKLAYQMMLERNSVTPGGTITKTNIKKIKEKWRKKVRKIISEKQIWRGLSKIDNPKIAQFIWKMIHGRIKCGPFFRHIPMWREKEYCRCGKSETLKTYIDKM